MTKLRYDEDVLELVCENPKCDERVCDMILSMSYHLENIDNAPDISVYGENDVDRDIESLLKCACGAVYEQDKDYTIDWDDDGWGMVIKHSG